MGAAILAVIAFGLGLVCGAGVFKYAFILATRYQRVGHIEPPAPAPETSSMPSDPEAAAHRRVLEESVKRGADDLMLMAEAAGETITRQDAEEEARAIIRGLHGSTPMGGVN